MMAMTMKSFFKGLKTISQIFVHREHEMEMEIGNPTDVRHLSHVGLGTADACPSWMSEYRGMDQELSAGSVAQSRHASWASLVPHCPPRSPPLFITSAELPCSYFSRPEESNDDAGPCLSSSRPPRHVDAIFLNFSLHRHRRSPSSASSAQIPDTHFEQTPRATASTLPVEEQLCPADSSGAGQDPAAGSPNKKPPPTTRRKRNRKASRASSSSSSFATTLSDLSEPHPHGHGPAPLRAASCLASC